MAHPVAHSLFTVMSSKSESCKFPCKYPSCNQTFDAKKSLSQHCYDYHSALGTVTIQKRRFTSITRQDGLLSCPLPACTSKVKTRSAFTKHIAAHNSKDEGDPVRTTSATRRTSSSSKRHRDSSPSVPEVPSSNKKRKTEAFSGMPCQAQVNNAKPSSSGSVEMVVSQPTDVVESEESAPFVRYPQLFSLTLLSLQTRPRWSGWSWTVQ